MTYNNLNKFHNNYTLDIAQKRLKTILNNYPNIINLCA